MTDPYVELAPLYDLMTADPGIRALYREFRRALSAAAAARRLHLGVIVDLACGTGNTAVPWARSRRRTVVGVDVSEAMLRVARTKSSSVRWVRQDLAGLSLDVTADAATCHFDALNHVLEADRLQQIFTRTARHLRPGGLFVFDLTTKFWLVWLAGSEKHFRAGPNVFMAYNAFDRETGIATFRQLWFVKRGPLYESFLVTVKERSFEDVEIRRMLQVAGLRLEEMRVLSRLKGRPIRKLYVAVRTKAPAAGRKGKYGAGDEG